MGVMPLSRGGDKCSFMMQHVPELDFTFVLVMNLYKMSFILRFNDLFFTFHKEAEVNPKHTTLSGKE